MTTLPQTSYLIHEHQYRSLGTTGIMVSPLGVGTNKWMQGRNDEPVSQVTQSFLDAGGNFFDTAEVYGLGKSERLLGCSGYIARPFSKETVFTSEFRQCRPSFPRAGYFEYPFLNM